MAYLSKEKIKEIRKNIRVKFPSKDGWKISVVNKHYSVVDVTILKAPIRFIGGDYEQLNPFYPDYYENPKVLSELVDICNDGNYNNSDPMTDYFDVGWYVHVSQGNWDVPFEFVTV